MLQHVGGDKSFGRLKIVLQKSEPEQDNIRLPLRRSAMSIASKPSSSGLCSEERRGDHTQVLRDAALPNRAELLSRVEL